MYECFAQEKSVLKHLALPEDKKLVLLNCTVLAFALQLNLRKSGFQDSQGFQDNSPGRKVKL